MVRVEADAIEQEGDAPAIRLRIEAIEPERHAQTNDGRALVLALTIKEAVAARDALNQALNALGLPDQD